MSLQFTNQSFSRGFTFDNNHNTNYFYVKNIKRPFSAPISPKLLTVPKRKGAIDNGTEADVLQFEVRIFVLEEDKETFDSQIDSINEWLIHEDLKELIFDDRPNRKYMARLIGETDIEDDILNYGEATLTFLVPDGQSYEDEQSVTIPPEGLNFWYEGNEDTNPIFDIEFTQDSTFFTIATPDKWTSVGSSTAIDDAREQKPRYELIDRDDMEDTVGWTSSGNQIDGGLVTGTIESDNADFFPATWGSGSGWHGPSKKRTISEALSDFRVDMTIRSRNQSGQVGRIELYLFDENNVNMGKIALKDTNTNEKMNQGEARLGSFGSGTYFFDNQDYKKGIWNDFYGMLRIQRKGTLWHAYITQLNQSDNYKHYFNRRDSYRLDNLPTDKLASIQVHFGAYGTRDPFPMEIRRVDTIKINDIDNEIQVPLVARAGQILTIDTAASKVYLDGEERNDLLNRFSEWVVLTKGENQIACYPSDIANVTMRYKVRWK
ncbi:phage tail family protein [Alkalihalobacillus macyae]|uniref:distal tail protein Dit n=1 Tax=Guptibacillus hwajinpoensis TaxID=208199 RepID=UPI00273CEC95|nr:distal tail protein Dit [Alkalihalobacillus macyae]MDP4549858.1 phage tail family protein [Alkalihalobacillus macyae]